MNEDRLLRALRAGPGSGRGYVPGGVEGLLRGDRHRSRVSLITTAADVLVGAAIVIAVFAIRGTAPDNRVGAGLPVDLATSGRIEILVTSGTPQAFVSGEYQGFDIEVARAVADELGLQAQIDVVTAEELRAGSLPAAWDLALDLPVDASRGALAGSVPFLWRSAAVVAPSGSALEAGSLDGARLCVVAGSAAARWIAGGIPAGDGSALPAPSRVSVREAADAAGCRSLVTEGASDAYVADWGIADGQPGEGLEIIPGTPFSLPAAWSVNGGRPEPGRLRAAVDAALLAMQADGRLHSLSETWFGVGVTSRP